MSAAPPSTNSTEALEAKGESQATICAWIVDTFGTTGSNFSIAARANQEVAELLKALADDDSHPKAREEVADIVIVLMRLVDRLGGDLWAEINAKMAINRLREWRLDGHGHGYHVKSSDAGAREQALTTPRTETDQ